MTVYTQNVIHSQLVIPHVELSNPSFNCLAKLEAPNLNKIIKYCVGEINAIQYFVEYKSVEETDQEVSVGIPPKIDIFI